MTPDKLGPSIPEEVLVYLYAYGDSRADDDGLSGLRIAESVLALRRWAAQVHAAAYAAGAAAEREACAQVCDHIADQQERANYDKRAACAADQCAIAIRQRAAYRDLTPDELAAADRRPESGDFDRRNHG